MNHAHADALIACAYTALGVVLGFAVGFFW